MKIEQFDLERGQSLWEHVVEVNLSESGVHPVTLRELGEMGLDLEVLAEVPLGYVQTNGSVALRSILSNLYPGADGDCLEVTNGTSEANFLITQVLVEPGCEVLVEVPNYLQVAGLARALGAEVKTFSLRRAEAGWEVDWQELERNLGPRTRMIYVSHPNNPTGHVLSAADVDRLTAAADSVGAYLLADEVYRGSEHDGEGSPGFWGRSERVIVVAGLSKAYGLPGLRIGWIAAEPGLVAECWSHHDYTTIAPSALGDEIAQFALLPEIAARLQERARSFMTTNSSRFASRVDDQPGLLDFSPPQAGAYAFARYAADVPSVDLFERLRRHQSVLVVPGAWAGLDGYLRLGLGTPAELFEVGLERMEKELATLRMPAAGR